MIDKVTKRYASSFFKAVENLKNFVKISSEMMYLSKLINENKQFYTFLKSPVISKDKKIKIISKLFEKRLNNILFDFLIILIQNNREYALKGIIKEFFNLKDSKDNILRIKIYSAIGLKNDIKKYIIKEIEKYTKKNIIAEFIVNSELIGGLKIYIADYVIDGTIRRQLELLKLKLNEYPLINDKIEE